MVLYASNDSPALEKKNESRSSQESRRETPKKQKEPMKNTNSKRVASVLDKQESDCVVTATCETLHVNVQLWVPSPKEWQV
jgi:hypothetical protein